MKKCEAGIARSYAVKAWNNERTRNNREALRQERWGDDIQLDVDLSNSKASIFMSIREYNRY
jgi:hypothetical protein